MSWSNLGGDLIKSLLAYTLALENIFSCISSRICPTVQNSSHAYYKLIRYVTDLLEIKDIQRKMLNVRNLAYERNLFHSELLSNSQKQQALAWLWFSAFGSFHFPKKIHAIIVTDK